MEPPFVLRVTEPIRLCGRLLYPGDRVSVYPGQGVYSLLHLPPNYGAVLGAMADGALEPLTPSLSPGAFAQAVGLDPAPVARGSLPRSARRWGAKLQRERSGLTVLP